MTPALIENRREAARMIELARPGWMVIYGIYSRQYVAFPLFHAPSGTIVTASYPPALMTRMQRAEALISRLSPITQAPGPCQAPSLFTGTGRGAAPARVRLHAANRRRGPVTSLELAATGRRRHEAS